MSNKILDTRNKTAIYQAAVRSNRADRVERVYSQLEAILPQLGAQSHSRKMINRIGLLLLEDTVTIVAPSCPDYAHRDGKYTFTELGSGVPLLTQMHLRLFDAIAPHLPQAQFEIVIADQEAEDAALCAMTGTTEHTFRARILASAQATENVLSDRPYHISLMTKRFPNLQALEKKFIAEINTKQELSSRITSDTIARRQMYQKIGVRGSDDMTTRTIKTAAQYCALAHLAATENFLVCNHETVNLSWYNRHEAAVLHNSVSIY